MIVSALTIHSSHGESDSPVGGIVVLVGGGLIRGVCEGCGSGEGEADGCGDGEADGDGSGDGEVEGDGVTSGGGVTMGGA
jgi:hypothetical protein